jgi:hypothetical protein
MSTDRRRGGVKALGLGALACLGCCAGPILAFLGGLSIAGLASTAVIGIAGLAIAISAAVGYLAVRRRRTLACSVTYSNAEAVPVAAPTRKQGATP